jgi:hypothetical protein
MTGSSMLAAEVGCTSSVLHTNTSTTVDNRCERKTAGADEDPENFVHWNLEICFYLFQYFVL